MSLESVSADRQQAARVLLVDDSLVNQKLLIGVLNRRGFTVTCVANGQQAIDAWGAMEFDVILMDVQMPVMDGLAATRHIRQQESGTARRTPIIAVTAGIGRTECLDSGMDEYLQKPVKPEPLLNLIDLVLRAASGDRLRGAVSSLPKPTRDTTPNSNAL